MKRAWALWALPLVHVTAAGCGGLEDEASLEAETEALEATPAQLLKQRLVGSVPGAHQGGIFDLDQNTLPRFRKAWESGARVIETDLRLSADGVVVIYHDADLSTWTWCSGQVSSKTVAQLKQCRFKFNSYTIPTFAELMTWAKGKVVVNAEAKVTAAIAPAVRLVESMGASSWVYFQTQSRSMYQTARSVSATIPLHFDPSSYDDINWALGLRDPALVVIELHKSTNDSSAVWAIRGAGKLASENAWDFTFADEYFGAACNKVFRRGINIAISNRPGKCASQAASTPLP